MKKNITDKEFDALLSKCVKIYVEESIRKIENSPEYKNETGFSQEAYENLMRRVQEYEDQKK